ncbi:hypothetical protein MASSI9I_20385 [Massilia sp. 9I]|nr:hypothetical protein MASSI9I_20385 [Massilia sp. 9I]
MTIVITASGQRAVSGFRLTRNVHFIQEGQSDVPLQTRDKKKCLYKL